jgi:hypothetical protein
MTTLTPELVDSYIENADLILPLTTADQARMAQNAMARQAKAEKETA